MNNRLGVSKSRFLDLSLVIGASGIRGLGQWLFIFILVRVGGPVDVGVYGLATALVVPITSLTSLQLGRVLATERKGSEDFGGFLALRVAGIAANIAIFLPISWLIDDDTGLVVFALVIQICAMAIVEIYQSNLLQYNHLRAYGLSNCVVNLTGWATAAIALYSWHRMDIALLLSGAMIIASYGLTRTFRSMPRPPKFMLDWHGLQRILRYTWPLGIALSIDSLVSHIPRLFLDRIAGPYELGILVGLLTLLSASSLFSESVTQALTPKITSLVHSDVHQKFRAFRLWTSWGLLSGVAVFCVLAYFIGPDVIGLILAPVYAEYALALSGVMMVAGLQFMFKLHLVALNASRHANPILIVNVVALATVIPLSIIAIPRWGVSGAALALVGSNFARWASILWVLTIVEREMLKRNSRATHRSID